MPCATPGWRGLSADEHVRTELGISAALKQDDFLPCPATVDLTHADFALLCGRTGLAAGAISWFYLSDDRCHSWQGPYRLPCFGLPGVSARTDYLVQGPGECLLFLTAAKSDGQEGRAFCARTR